MRECWRSILISWSDTLLTTSLYRPKPPYRLLIASLLRCQAILAEKLLSNLSGFSKDHTDSPVLELPMLCCDLLEKDGIVVENAEDVANAAELYPQSTTNFSDLMILAAAQRVGANPSTPSTKGLPVWKARPFSPTPASP